MQEKFTEFYKMYETFMYYIANAILGDSYAAEDAVQTAFVNIYKKFQGVGDIGSKRTKHFVVTVTKRVAIDMYRRRQRQSARELSLEELQGSEGNQRREIVVEDNKVIECIRRIPKRYADVMILMYVDGYKTREIAEILGCAQGTVSSQIFRGKKLLREELKKNGIKIVI